MLRVTCSWESRELRHCSAGRFAAADNVAAGVCERKYTVAVGTVATARGIVSTTRESEQCTITITTVYCIYSETAKISQVQPNRLNVSDSFGNNCWTMCGQHLLRRSAQ